MKSELAEPQEAVITTRKTGSVSCREKKIDIYALFTDKEFSMIIGGRSLADLV